MHVVRESFAVAEFSLENLFGRCRLLAADAELDADVTGRFSQVIVQGADFLAVGCQAVRAAVYFGPKRFREPGASFPQSALPCTVRCPVAHAAPCLFIFELLGYGEYQRHEIQDRGRRGFRFYGRDSLQHPAIDVAAVGRLLRGGADVEAFVAELHPGGDGDRVDSLFEGRAFRAHRDECREVEEPVLVGHFIFVTYRVGVRRGVDLQVVGRNVRGEAPARKFGVFQV